MKLLLAEDETALNEAITDILVYHKYLVDSVYDGADALDYARLGDYDGIILDIMMPEKDGLEVLSTLRREGIKTPVLLLTAKSEIEDRIAGLDAGADDYLPKPFAMGELLARIRAMLRRREDFTPDVLTLYRAMICSRRSGAMIPMPKSAPYGYIFPIFASAFRRSAQRLKYPQKEMSDTP